MAELVMEGWAELKPKLLALPDKLVKQILDQSMRQAANVIRDEARNRAPVDSGALKASIRTTKRRGTRDSVRFSVVAGSELTKAKQERYGIKAPFYASFVEYGHWVNTGKALGGSGKDEARQRRIAAGETRMVPPHPFMRPASEAAAQLAIDFVMVGISDRLESLAT